MKKKRIAIICGVLILALAGGLFACTKETEAALGENQRYAYAYVMSMEGNEITYMEVDESLVVSTEEDSTASQDENSDTEGTESTEAGKNSMTGPNAGSDTSESGTTSDTGTMPSGETMPGNGTMPSGGDMPSDGTMPSGENMPGNGTMPSGGDMPSDGTMPDGGTTEMPDMSSQSSGNAGGKMMQQMDGTTVTTYVPVGVTVHTTADTTTTFARLVSGDVLKLLLETDADGNEVIEEIWMVE